MLGLPGSVDWQKKAVSQLPLLYMFVTSSILKFIPK